MNESEEQSAQQQALLFLLEQGVPATHVAIEREVPGGLLYSYWLDGSLAHGEHMVFVDEITGDTSWSRMVIVDIV